MNAIFSLIQLLTLHSFLSSIRSDLSVPPLIFNTSTHEIYPTWESVPENGGPYVIACPTESREELNFEGKYSLDYHSILVRYGSEKKIPELGEKKCSRGYKLSAALHSPLDKEPWIEFGYEVFFEPSWSKIILKESAYKDFQKIREAISTQTHNENNSKRETGPIMQINIPVDEKSTSKTAQDVKMGFVWLPKIVVRYDIPTLSIKSATYYLDKTTDKSKLEVKCNNDFLGVELYGRKRLYQYYFLHYQVFKQVKLPVAGNSPCKSWHNCLKKYNLLFPYQFQSVTTAIVSCSDLTTIPLWYETIQDTMNYLEKFLIAVAQVAPNKLKITLGVHEILSFPAIEGNEPLPIYLDVENRRLPVPKIIYRIVGYQSHHKCESEKESCWFDMVIVIHNQPEVSKDDIICEDKCEIWGWDSIQYLSTTDKKEENKSQFVYCCELNETVRTLLDYKEDTHKREDLDLKQFPYGYDENTKEIEKRNIPY